MGKNYRLLLVLIAGGLLVLILPIHFGIHRGYVMRDRDETVKLIEEFHSRLNEGRFDQIYDDASSALQRSDGRQVVAGTMREIHQNYGAFLRIESSKIEVVMVAPVEIRAVYDSVFERGYATERFVYVIEGRDIRLRTYLVSPLKRDPSSAIGQRIFQHFPALHWMRSGTRNLHMACASSFR